MFRVLTPASRVASLPTGPESAVKDVVRRDHGDASTLRAALVREVSTAGVVEEAPRRASSPPRAPE
jgi:hypothetical protein